MATSEEERLELQLVAGRESLRTSGHSIYSMNTLFLCEEPRGAEVAGHDDQDQDGTQTREAAIEYEKDLPVVQM